MMNTRFNAQVGVSRVSGYTPIHGILKQHWPALVLLVLGGFGYLDLRSEISEIQTQNMIDRAVAEATSSSRSDEVGSREPEPVEQASHGGDDAEPAREAPLVEVTATSDAARAANWECTGTLDQRAVRSAIGRQGPEIFRCHEEVAESRPEVRGTLVLELKVGVGGEVENARVGGVIQDRQLLACIGQAVSSWRFTPPEGGDCAVVSAPFMLGAASADAQGGS